MHEAAASGEILAVWVSPFAQFLFDIVFAVAILAAATLLAWVLRKARTKSGSAS